MFSSRTPEWVGWAKDHKLTIAVGAVGSVVFWPIVDQVISAILSPINEWLTGIFQPVLPAVVQSVTAHILASVVSVACMTALYFFGRRNAEEDLQKAGRIKDLARPLVKLSLDDANNGVDFTIELRAAPHELPRRIDANYVRATVTALDDFVGSSRVFIREVWTSSQPTGPLANVKLPAGGKIEIGTVEVAPGVPASIEIARANAVDNQLVVAGAWPFTLHSMVSQARRMRLRIMVSDLGPTQAIWVELKWDLAWNQFSAKEVSDEQHNAEVRPTLEGDGDRPA